jgi:hypothetical protein
VVDDTYNSNPEALASVLGTLAASAPAGRRVLVMGDMLELGAQAAAFHRAAGERAAASGVALLVAVGPLSRTRRRDGAEGGVEVHTADDAPAAAKLVPDLVREGDLVVVKGSRGIRLEHVIEALLTRHRDGGLMLYDVLYRLHTWSGPSTSSATSPSGRRWRSSPRCSCRSSWARLIESLRRFQIGQEIREEGPKSHQSKRGTPTMGGILIIASVVPATLLWATSATRSCGSRASR